MRRKRSAWIAILCSLVLIGSAACGDDESKTGQRGQTCQPGTADACVAGLVCAERTDATYACYEPVVLRGQVVDSVQGTPIAGARVIALDEESVAVGDVAISDGDGRYAIAVPAIRSTGDANGAPTSTFTLRAQADAYQTFPGGVRTALPIVASEATLEENVWVVESPLTTIALIPLAGGDEGYAVSGSVAAGGEAGSGVLVVVDGANGVLTAISDAGGEYVVFNVPNGDYEVSGYAAGLQLAPAAVTVDEADVSGVDLNPLQTPLTRLSGSIQMVNAPGDAVTSVILVVASTFDEDAGRGEAPRGLRAPRTGAPDVSGSWTIEGVPDGRYVILAAFENDDLVRDPDLNIGGTETLTIEIPHEDGTDVNLSDSFKVTEALDVVSPGAGEPEAVEEKPDLVFQNDTSEDWYEVRVYDAFGRLVWEDLDVPGESGQSPPISVPYEGPLESGMYYQFRATSWRQPGGQEAAAISATEDLRGVFYRPSEEQ